jgi:hypothetical protein
MKRLINYILIVLATALLQLFLPWWIIALIPFVLFLVRPERPVLAFVTSLVGVATVWAAYIMYLHSGTPGSMSNRIAELFFLPNGIVLAVLSVLIGGCVAGFSGLAGALVRPFFAGKRY